jgi:isopenicillin N synthase-like dioxygenase
MLKPSVHMHTGAVPAPPVIDITRLDSETAPPADLVRAIDAACVEIGFFVATGHGLERPLADVFTAAHQLFALDEADKETLAMVDRQGFVPARHRVLDRSLHSAPMEYYDVGTGGAGRWPSSDLPAFEATVRGYQRAVLGVASSLLRAIAAALDLAPSFFDERMTAPQCFLRMMHYEPRPAEPVVLTDPHTDYGLITLLATDGVGGLEVRARGGEWSMVSAPPGSLVVNLGDMLARWTNDRYVSTPHRVSAPTASDRFSVPFFVNPDPDTVVSCLPSCVGADHPCRYPAVTASEFLAERIRQGGYMTADS